MSERKQTDQTNGPTRSRGPGPHRALKVGPHRTVTNSPHHTPGTASRDTQANDVSTMAAHKGFQWADGARRTSSSADNGSDLAAVFGSLRASAMTPSTALSTPQQDRSLMRYNHPSGDNGLTERVRQELQDQDRMAVNLKLLRLSDQVAELMEQRAVAEQKQAASDRTNAELQDQVAVLRTQLNTHHVQLEANKALLGERARESHVNALRIDELSKNLSQQVQQQTRRIDIIDGQIKKHIDQIKDHSDQLNEDYIRMADLGKAVKALKKNGPVAIDVDDQVDPQNPSEVLEEVKSLRTSHGNFEKYLSQVAEMLTEHQSSIKSTETGLSGMRARLELVTALVGSPGGQQEDSSQRSGIRMTPRDSALLGLHDQINKLEAQMQQQTGGRPTSNTSSLDTVEALDVKIDLLRSNVQKVEETLNAIGIKHKHQDSISMAHKFVLQEMFRQLTKEMDGGCSPAEVVFGADFDGCFILRQRVLERLAIDDMVQVEFERVKNLPS